MEDPLAHSEFFLFYRPDWKKNIKMYMFLYKNSFREKLRASEGHKIEKLIRNSPLPLKETFQKKNSKTF